MENSIMLQNLSVAQLQELIGSAIQSGIQEIQKQQFQKNNAEELMTREETCQFLKVDQSTLWQWTKSGKLNVHGIGARRYYKRSEILECLTLKRTK